MPHLQGAYWHYYKSACIHKTLICTDEIAEGGILTSHPMSEKAQEAHKNYKEKYTCKPCFMPFVSHLSTLMPPCQFTPLLSLSPLIISLRPVAGCTLLCCQESMKPKRKNKTGRQCPNWKPPLIHAWKLHHSPCAQCLSWGRYWVVGGMFILIYFSLFPPIKWMKNTSTSPSATQI